jgi:hypothetical protein
MGNKNNFFWSVVVFCCSAGCSTSSEPIQLSDLPQRLSIAALREDGFSVEGVGYTLDNIIEYKIEKSNVTYSIEELSFTAGFRGYAYEDGSWLFFYITNCDTQLIDIIAGDTSSYVSRYQLSLSDDVQEHIGDEIIFNEQFRLKLIVNRIKREIHVSRI